MKRLFSLLSLATIIFFSCSKNNGTNNNTLVLHKTLVANAGLDTVINIPLPGTGFYFEAILNGRASHDSAGKIVFYSWRAVDDSYFPVYNIMSPGADSTEVILLEFS